MWIAFGAGIIIGGVISFFLICGVCYKQIRDIADREKSIKAKQEKWKEKFQELQRYFEQRDNELTNRRKNLYGIMNNIVDTMLKYIPNSDAREELTGLSNQLKDV
jgi:uncharacterized membrane-anchored protein YhcB (DUF1043 family)